MSHLRVLGGVQAAIAHRLKGLTQQRPDGGVDQIIVTALPGGCGQLRSTFQAGSGRLLARYLGAQRKGRGRLLHVQQPHEAAQNDSQSPRIITPRSREEHCHLDNQRPYAAAQGHA